jgi:predicted RND superfamily exporter protein
LGIALFVLSVAPAVDLYAHLRTDLRELLPEGAPASLALRELEQRVGSLASLTVVVRCEHPATGRQFVDEFSRRLRLLPEVRRVDASIAAEQTFLATHGLLYLPLSDLRRWLERLQLARQRANPLHVALDDEPSAAAQPDPSPPPWRQWASAWPGLSRFPDGYLASADGRVLVVQVQPARSAVDLDDALALTTAVQRLVASLGPPVGVEVGYGGEVQGLVEAQAHVRADLVTSSLLVLAAVAAVLWAFFRSWRALPLLGFPVAAGALVTFALSRGVLGTLNPNTAFLGSIIIGNGINSGILWLAAFQAALTDDRGPVLAARQATETTWRGTFTAALAASASFASLGLVDFRGFHQFGFMGGLGMLACWLATYAFLPACALLLEGWRPTRRSGRTSTATGWRGWTAAMTGRPRTMAAALLLCTLAALPGVWRWWRAPIEFDMSRLGSRRSEVDGARSWNRQADAVLGSYQTPTVVLTDSEDDTARVAEALRGAMARPGSTIARVTTLDGLVPTEQAAKLPVIAQLLRLAAPGGKPVGGWLAEIPEAQRPWLMRLAREGQATPVTIADLPARWRAPFRQSDGRLADRLVLVHPHLELEPGAGFLHHAREVRGVVAQVAEAGAAGDRATARVAGAMVLTSDLLAAVSADGQTASWCSLLAVVLLTGLTLRRATATAWIMGALALGVLWLLGIMGWAGLRFNFANFTVMPITFGIGVDYAVNFFQRREQAGRVDTALRESAGAIFLCSLTTILGYAALVIADNRAMQLFGITAVLGEVTCLAAALLALPVALVWIERWKFRSSLPNAG